jgi:hypothetical protein
LVFTENASYGRIGLFDYKKGIPMAKRGRPPGTGKPPGEKFVLRTFRFPPSLWEEFAAVVPAQERSKRIRDYMAREIRKHTDRRSK